MWSRFGENWKMNIGELGFCRPFVTEHLWSILLCDEVVVVLFLHTITCFSSDIARRCEAQFEVLEYGGYVITLIYLSWSYVLIVTSVWNWKQNSTRTCSEESSALEFNLCRFGLKHANLLAFEKKLERKNIKHNAFGYDSFPKTGLFIELDSTWCDTLLRMAALHGDR